MTLCIKAKVERWFTYYTERHREKLSEASVPPQRSSV